MFEFGLPVKRVRGLNGFLCKLSFGPRDPDPNRKSPRHTPIFTGLALQELGSTRQKAALKENRRFETSVASERGGEFSLVVQSKRNNLSKFRDQRRKRGGTRLNPCGNPVCYPL